MGEANRFTATVESRSGDALQMATEQGQILRGLDASRTISTGDNVDVFVRPEAVRLSRKRADIADLGNTGQGTVVNVLFNGANSQLILRDQQAGDEMSVALPQTGEFRDLSQGDVVYFGWEQQQTRVYLATGGAR